MEKLEKLHWMSTHTMISDALTESATPLLLLSATCSRVYQVDEDKNRKKNAER